ncbi:zinc ribbon domain-containing protein [Streptomyces sp. TG1A-60]|uniref:zinc ribbon domain-containing protein n=1 Tax=Streptomyces sp. TG1A-60 TaxID=3129111 RepID=UPI0030D03656
MTTRLIDESLFDGDFGGGSDAGDPPRLVGARCCACGTVVFPGRNPAPGARTG